MIPQDELQYDIFSNNAEVVVRIIHLPTGLVGESDSSKNRTSAKIQAMERLQSKMTSDGSDPTEAS